MKTILGEFYKNASEFGVSPCFLTRDRNPEAWRAISWREVLDQVSRLAAGLKSIGVGKGDSVAIFSNTRYEWTIIDIAVMSVGAVTVPIYHTQSLDQIAYILKHSSSGVLFVEDRELLDRVSGVLKDVKNIVLIEAPGSSSGEILLFSELMDKGCDNGQDYPSLIKDIVPADVATCIYTSGTTGEPKGVLITHANIMGEISGLKDVFQFGRDDVGLLFLPLAHVIARAMQFFQLSEGCITAYEGSIDRLADSIIEVQPHFMAVVPRVMEKIYERIHANVAAASWFKYAMFSAAIKAGRNASRQVRLHDRLSFPVRIKNWMFRKLVFGKIFQKMGGRLKFTISGGAPLNKAVAEFFHAVGIMVLEGYGLTETMAAIAINRPDDFKFGSVGKPLNNTQIRIADDGEILVKGPQVFKGYKSPVNRADSGCFEGGWFMTGDLGDFSRDGFLRLTGRKKDLIVTSSGKNIAPQRVENMIKSSPYVSDVVVFGDGQKYLIALITIDCNRVREFAKRKGLKISQSGSELAKDRNIYKLIKSEIEYRNRGLARHETVKKFRIIDHDFSEERGERTPTLKLRRKQIFERYKNVIEGMYKG